MNRHYTTFSSNCRNTVVMLLLFSFHSAAQNGYVHQSGSRLLDGDGKELKLTGVNLGGWLLWEGWIWGGGFKAEKKIDEKIALLYGKDSVQLFKRQIHENYITEGDLKAISELGMNVVRVPFNHTLLESDDQPFVYKEEGFELLDSLLSWCEKYKVYAVLDLHAAPGGQNAFFISDPDKTGLWKSDENQKRTAALWCQVARRYAGRKIIAGYDLLNEPKIKDGAMLDKLYRRLADTIRTVDKEHLLIIEGNHLAAKFDFFKAKYDSNMILSFHYYTWFNEKNKLKTLAPHVVFQDRTGIPLWCGEWGEDNPGNIREITGLLRDPAYNFCGDAFWTWKKDYKDNKKLPLAEITFPADAQAVINYIAGNGRKPSPATAASGWSSVVRAVRMENCYLNEPDYEL